MIILSILIALFLLALLASSIYGIVCLAQKEQWVWIALAVFIFLPLGILGFYIPAKPGSSWERKQVLNAT